jgi:hypothetical protein
MLTLAGPDFLDVAYTRVFVKMRDPRKRKSALAGTTLEYPCVVNVC